MTTFWLCCEVAAWWLWSAWGFKLLWQLLQSYQDSYSE